MDKKKTIVLIRHEEYDEVDREGFYSAMGFYEPLKALSKKGEERVEKAAERLKEICTNNKEQTLVVSAFTFRTHRHAVIMAEKWGIDQVISFNYLRNKLDWKRAWEFIQEQLKNFDFIVIIASHPFLEYAVGFLRVDFMGLDADPKYDKTDFRIGQCMLLESGTDEIVEL